MINVVVVPSGFKLTMVVPAAMPAPVTSIPGARPTVPGALRVVMMVLPRAVVAVLVVVGNTRVGAEGVGQTTGWLVAQSFCTISYCVVVDNEPGGPGKVPCVSEVVPMTRAS
jgi:hypothetical protein